MATNTSNGTLNTWFLNLPASQCIPWIVVLITESLFIVILNFLTVIVFATHRQLQRRNTYLLFRNLAIVDLLAGAISGPLQIERVGEDCDVWEYSAKTQNWKYYLKFALLHLFSMASFGNLAAISLERMHATLCPSKHLFMKKWVYKVIIVVIWLTACIRELAQIVLSEVHQSHPKLFTTTLYVPYYSVCLCLICVSYSSIFIKIRFSPRSHPQCGGVTIREQQLTATLFVVTVVSVLTLLPAIIYLCVDTFVITLQPYYHIRMAVVVCFLTNSLANPIIYAMRMQGFRTGLAELFGGTSNHVTAVNLPLRRY